MKQGLYTMIRSRGFYTQAGAFPSTKLFVSAGERVLILHVWAHATATVDEYDEIGMIAMDADGTLGCMYCLRGLVERIMEPVA